jgi:hypothetical protein
MMKYILIFTAVLFLTTAAQAQEKNGYIPFPPNYKTMTEEQKKSLIKVIEANMEKYFRSPDYGMALGKFVEKENPKGIHECKDVKMDAGKNNIHVSKPLLWKSPTDRHPYAGKWEQTASFVGCNKTYDFVINIDANKSNMPTMSLKP